MATKNPIKLTDRLAEALTEFADDSEPLSKVQGLHPDKVVAGLFLYVGPRKSVWRFRARRTTRNKSGRRPTIAKSLGTFQTMSMRGTSEIEVTTADARRAALALASDAANDKAPPSKRDAVTFERAWPVYLEKLLRKARDNDKPPRHHDNAKHLGDSLILPQWGKWTLIDMAQAPEDVEQWHAKVTRIHGPVSANRACELIRATYNHRAARDVNLSLDRIPTSSVQWNEEKPSQVALAPKDFKKWRAAWDDLSDIQRGYFLFCLLAGPRPGEAARIRKQNIDRKARAFTLRNVKTPKGRKDIVLPLTKEIEYAIDLALNAPPTSPTITMKGMRGMKRGQVRVVARKKPHHEIIDPDFIFPGCRRMPSRSGLPVAGQALRHTVRTIHAEIGVSDMLSSFLLGHALEGVNKKYTAELIILQGKALRAAQEKVSKHVFKLLGLTLAPLRDGPHKGSWLRQNTRQSRAVK
jgi:hypothetical protein